MRLSIPGVPGAYYDTDARSTALSVLLTAAGRRAPKPQGYAVQVLPQLWSIDIDLEEVPPDHPIHYLHPEGAPSLEQLAREQGLGVAGRELDRALLFAWAVNEETEAAIDRLIGRVEDPALDVDLESEFEQIEPITIEVEDEREERVDDGISEESLGGHEDDTAVDDSENDDDTGSGEFSPDKLGSDD